MVLWISKLRRILRHVPREWREFIAYPLLDRGSLWAGILSVIGLAIVFSTASQDDVSKVMADWATWAKAFGWALVIWGIVGLVRAPFAVVAKDRAKGRWQKNHFLYHHKELIFQRIFSANGGNTQTAEVFFEDAEPGAFVKLVFDVGAYQAGTYNVIMSVGSGQPDNTIELRPPSLNELSALGFEPTSTVGIRLSKSRKATLYVRLSPEQSAKTLRVYCTGFFVGKESEFGV